jgi:hypothetical protein
MRYTLDKNDVHGTAQNRRVKIEERNEATGVPSFSPYRFVGLGRPLAVSPFRRYAHSPFSISP